MSVILKPFRVSNKSSQSGNVPIDYPPCWKTFLRPKRRLQNQNQKRTTHRVKIEDTRKVEKEMFISLEKDCSSLQDLAELQPPKV